VYTGTSLPVEPTETAPGVFAMRSDSRNIGDLERTIDFAAALGSLDILVNCAGVSVKESIGDLTEENWSRIMETNVRATVFAIKYAMPYMRQQDSGSIVNVSSISAFNTLAAGNTSYVATKGAQMALTRSLVYELAPHGIRINAVAPGLVDTRILDNLTKEDRASRSALVPAGRFGTPAEIAKVIAFLASDESSYINGHTIVADGSLTAVTYAPLAQSESCQTTVWCAIMNPGAHR
jgi:NAD(P)-dependent dehydrogenase (short-subunit alcohol dehydrogenase family)